MRRALLLGAVVAALVVPPPAVAAADWSWPVRGQVVTPYRNGDDPYAAGQHRGIDIGAPVGTAIEAATSGRVTYVGVAGTSGLTVSVRSGDGRFDLSYLHLSAAAVVEGDQVDRGERLGAVGTSGRRSVEAPHLHFGVREAASATAYRDPLDFLPPLAPPAAQPESPAVAPARAPQTAPPAAAPVRVPDPAAAPATGPVGAPAPARAPSPLPAASAVAAPYGAHAAGVASSGIDARSPSRPHVPRLVTPSAHAGVAPRDGLQVARLRPVSAAAHGHAAEPDGRTARLTTPTAGPAALGRAPASGAEAWPPARTSRAAVQAPDSSGGVDAGWLAALIGMVVAATCLGAPERSRKAVRSGRAAVAGLMRPLVGR
jgi:hypothetical protein